MKPIEIIIYELILTIAGVLIITTMDFSGSLVPLIIEITLFSAMILVPICSDITDDNETDEYIEDEDEEIINKKISVFLFNILIVSIVYTISMFILIIIGILDLPIAVAFLPAIVALVFFIISGIIIFLMSSIYKMNNE